MTENSETSDDTKLTQAQKTNIVQNFLLRVNNISRRAKIQRIALSLSDFDDTSDDYFALLNFYSLEENWPTIDKDYEEFYVPGYSGDNEKSERNNPERN
jgi:hypothetical protein